MSRDFDGTDDKIDIGNISGSTAGYTACAWIFLDTVAAGGKGIIMHYSSASPNAAYSQFFHDGAGLNARIHQTRDSVYIGRKITSGLTITQWHFVAMTWDGGTTNAAIKVYRDGVQVDNADDGAGSFTGANTTSTPVWFGAQKFGAGNAFLNGKMAFVHRYNRNLSIDELNMIRRFPGSITRDLDSFHPLLGGSPEPDYTSNQRSGTITGALASIDNPPVNNMWYPRRPSLYYSSLISERFNSKLTIIGGL